MPNDKLNRRREFYIHRIVRNGKMYDDIDTNIQEAKTSSKSLANKKEPISYAESFGYHEDPKRYNILRKDKEKNLEKENPKYVEQPIQNVEMAYFDEGIKEENFVTSDDEMSNDGYFDNIDELYQESFEQTNTDEIFYDDNVILNNDVIEQKVEKTENEQPKKIANKKEKVIQANNHSNFTYKENPGKDKKTTTYYKSQKRVKYNAPSYDLLTRGGAENQDDIKEAEMQKQIINNTFNELNIKASVAYYKFGPTVTQFLISVEKGVSVGVVKKAESNLLMYLEKESIRIQTPIPGKAYAGIEVPKKIENRRSVYLGDMLSTKEWKNLKYAVGVAIGQDNYGVYHYIDLAEMPHGLIAGTTKSGKSVCLNTILLSLLYRFTPEELRLVIIDPKRIDLGIYEGIPHLAMPVIVDEEDFQSALGWVYDEMEKRYKEFELYDEHTIVKYNKIRKERKESIMPHIVVLMDEFSDWFADASQEVQMYLQKLAAKARAAGINIILATQRPSKDIIKGSIKANFDTRIAFRVSGFEDAKVIMGYGGAEKLEGYGDMLIRYAGRAEQRLQCAYTPDEDIRKVIKYLKENNEVHYLVTKEEIHQSTLARQTTKNVVVRGTGLDDEKFEEIAFYVVRNKNASINQILQKFGMGFNRVNDIFQAMEQLGVLGPSVKGKQREVLLDEFQLKDLLEQQD